MKKLRSFTDVYTISKYLCLFACFLIFNSLEQQVLPYSSAMLVCALINGCSVVLSPLLYVLAFLILGSPGLLGSAGIFAVFFIPVTLVYRKFSFKYNWEILFFTTIGLTGFVLLGNTAKEIEIEKRILTCVLTVFLTFICLVFTKAITKKGLKFKFGHDETASTLVVVALMGLGISNLLSPFVWKGLSAFVLLLVCYVYRKGTAPTVASVLGIALALYYKNLNYVAIFLVWSVSIESIFPLSRYAGALALLISDYLMQVLFSVYPDYQLIEFISVFVGSCFFCLTPTLLLKNIKERLYSFREKQLTREAINTNRTAISGKLYDISGVFTEMANAFSSFKVNNITEDRAKIIMEKQIYNGVCRECANFNRCKAINKNSVCCIDKLIDIGFAKGKLSLIDMPKEIAQNCAYPNSILFGLNKLLADYRLKLLEQANLNNGRDLLASEVLGVAEILRGLALETGSLVKYHSRLERTLSEQLFRAGFCINELLVFGENDRLSVSIVTAMKEFSISGIQSVITKTLGVNVQLVDRAKITEEKCYLSFSKAVEYDAVFGVANVVKDGSSESGDTHSVMRISNDKFLLALSDGMGSGEKANAVSSASLSLIESFYKAGLQSSLILQTVNKLLSINTEDTFTALDVSIIDFKNCSADFIKYGAPYGFIISDNGIKIVEGNTLPLGILDQLKPSVASTSLDGGDMIVLITDGVADAFSSSGEIIDFLRTVPAKNPQTLADDILKKALEKSGGKKNDDMTVLAVRVYKKSVA